MCTLRGHTDSVREVSFSPDGKKAVSVSDDTLVKIWDVATGAEVSSFVRVRCSPAWVLLWLVVQAFYSPLWTRFMLLNTTFKDRPE